MGGMATSLIAVCQILFFSLLLLQQGGTFGMGASEMKVLEAHLLTCIKIISIFKKFLINEISALFKATSMYVKQNEF